MEDFEVPSVLIGVVEPFVARFLRSICSVWNVEGGVSQELDLVGRFEIG